MSEELKGMRVLIADDSEAIRSRLKSLLTGLGVRLRVAENGVQALQIAQQQPGPQAIISDIEMPEMGGIEFCKNLKNIPACADIPVIFLSTLDNPKDILAGMRVGASDYLSKKSFSPEGLVRALKKYATVSVDEAPAPAPPPSSVSYPRSEAPSGPPVHEAEMPQVNSVRDLHLGMFANARIGIMAYTLGRQLLYANEFAIRRLGFNGTIPEQVHKALLKQAVSAYEEGAFEGHLFAQWMPGTGTVVNYRLEILTLRTGEATGVVILIE